MARLRLRGEEGSSIDYLFTLRDQAGLVVPLAAISSFTATLYLPGATEAVDTIINGRDAQSILNANGGEVHATSGAALLVLGPLDNVIVGAAATVGEVEEHVLMLELVLSTGRTRRWARRVLVENLRAS